MAIRQTKSAIAYAFHSGMRQSADEDKIDDHDRVAHRVTRIAPHFGSTMQGGCLQPAHLADLGTRSSCVSRVEAAIHIEIERRYLNDE